MGRGPLLVQSGGVQRLEISGEELAVGRFEIVLQHLLTGIEGSSHDGDDAAELAVGTEIADALDLLFGEFSHIGIAGSHRFGGCETGSLHIGNGLDREIFGGKRDRRDGHSDDGLFSGVLEDGHGRALGRLDRLGLRPAGGKVQRKVIGLYFISQRCGCAKKDTQETGCRKRQDFLHMILPKSLKKAKRFLIDRQQAEESPRGRFFEQAVRIYMTSEIDEIFRVDHWGRALTVWYGASRKHGRAACFFLHAGRAAYPWETARGLAA